MHKALITCVLFASAAIAQNQVLPGAHAATYNGFSRGMSYTAQGGHALVQMDAPTDAMQAGDGFSFGIWINGTLVAHSVGNTTVPVAVDDLTCGGPVVVNTGDEVIIIGGWGAIPGGTATAHNSYASGGSTFQVMIEGQNTTIYRAGVQHDVGDPAFATLGLLPFSGIAGSIGRLILYTTDLTNYATSASYGNGCINDPRMVWEVQAENTVTDMIGKSYFYHYDLASDRYQISETSVPYDASAALNSLNEIQVLPYSASSSANYDDATVNIDLTGGAIINGITPPAALVAGIQFPGGTSTDIAVNTNAKIYYGPVSDNSFATNGANYQDFLPFQGASGAGHAVLCPYNCDIDPTVVGPGAGIFIDIGQLGGLRITYHDCPNWLQAGSAAPVLNQIQVEFFSPVDILVTYGTTVGNGGSGGNDAIIGWSSGGGAPFATQIDWDQAIPTGPAFYQTGNGAVPLALTADCRPIVGTTVTLTLDNIPQGGAGSFAGFISGLAEYNPGLDLTALGMPGCEQYTDFGAVVLVVGAAASETWGFSIPNAPSLNGVEIKHQGACFNPTPGVIPNSLMALSSNGHKNTIGLQ